MQFTIEQAQQAMLAKLEPLRMSHNCEPQIARDDWELSGKTYARNMAILAFAGKQCTGPLDDKSLASRQVAQLCTLSWELVVYANSLRGDKGAIAICEAIEQALAGYRLHETTGLLYSTGFSYVRHDNRFWVYAGTFSVGFKQGTDASLGILPPLLQ